MFLLATLADAAVVSARRTGALTILTLTDGAAEVSWLSDSTFRFTRCWQSSCLSRSDGDASLDLKFREAPGELIWESAYVRLRMKRADLSLILEHVTDKSLLLSQGPVRKASPSGLETTVALTAEERLYGLNAGKLSIRGEKIETATPLVLSSAGYGLYFGMPGMYAYDLTSALHARNIQARQWEEFVYYGPTPKEILEEHRALTGPIRTPTFADLQGKPGYARPVPSLDAIPAASMSGILVPTIAGEYAWKDFAPGREWDWYLYTYLCEARDRGLPVLRPLAMQFPGDKEGALQTQEIMLGDEVLVALSGRTYLPQGIWTDLAAHTVHRGRQWIDTPGPVRKFVRNGTILPLLKNGVIELHYFPRLGAEFFLSEPGGEEISQIHAGPAGDILRLEIESKATRRYEWVIHHCPGIAAISAIGMPTPQYQYDVSRRELRIPVASPEGSDIILNLTLREALQ